MEKRDSSPASTPTESLVEMNRMNSLSDGVFAFALTLLAIDLRLPEGVSLGDLPNQLFALAPKFIVYLISFVVVGGAWSAHQRMLNQIKRGDGLLVWFNLFCLLFVALLPASAVLLGRYPAALLAIACFALNVALIQLTTQWLWRHASRQELINSVLDPRVVKSIGRRLTLSALIFALSIPLALGSIWITYLCWVGLFILLFTTDWLSWQLANRQQHATFPLDRTKRAHIHVQHKEGFLRIDAKAAATTLLEGIFGGGLESHVERSTEAATIQLRAETLPGFLNWKYPWSWGSPSVLDWTLHLSNRIPLSLEVETANEDAALELGELQITDLTLKTSVGGTRLSLPDREGTTTVQIHASTAMLMVCVPPDTAATIQNELITGSVQVNLDRFPMREKAREYRTAAYETATKRVDIRIGGTTSSVEIV